MGENHFCVNVALGLPCRRFLLGFQCAKPGPIGAAARHWQISETELMGARVSCAGKMDAAEKSGSCATFAEGICTLGQCWSGLGC